jgi:hypothetical protein
VYYILRVPSFSKFRFERKRFLVKFPVSKRLCPTVGVYFARILFLQVDGAIAKLVRLELPNWRSRYRRCATTFLPLNPEGDFRTGVISVPGLLPARVAGNRAPL